MKARYVRGLTYSSKGDYGQALADCNEAIKMATDKNWSFLLEQLPEAYRIRGTVYANKGNEDLAVADYQEAADWGDLQAREKLVKRGIQYKPRRPKIAPSDDAIMTFAGLVDLGLIIAGGVIGFLNGRFKGLGIGAAAGLLVGIGFTMLIQKPLKKLKIFTPKLSKFLKAKGNTTMAVVFGLVCAILIGTLASVIEAKITGNPQGSLPVLIAAAAVSLILGIIAWRNKIIVLKIILLVLCIGGGYIWYDANKSNRPASATTVNVKTAEVSVTVTSEALNMRSSPSADGELIKTLKTGDTLTVTGEAQSGWLPVEHDGDAGWVSAAYVDIGQQ
jgi:hypothetical protein